MFFLSTITALKHVQMTTSKLVCWKGLTVIEHNFSLYFQLSAVLLS